MTELSELGALTISLLLLAAFAAGWIDAVVGGGGLIQLPALLIGLPLGVHAATHRGSWSDRAATLFTTILVAAPSFLVGYLLLYTLAFQPQVLAGVEIFPIGGYKPFDIRYLALPAITLGFAAAAYYTRLTRTAMIDQLTRLRRRRGAAC